MKVNFKGLFDTLQIARAEAACGRLSMVRWIRFMDSSSPQCEAELRWALDAEASNALRRPMRVVDFRPCPTAACMVGSYALSKGLPWGNWLSLSDEMAGNKRLSAFLFTNHRTMIGVLHDYPRVSVSDAAQLTPAEAIRRLEKTIAYLNRKQSMWETEPERMRNQEGDWGFVTAASREVEPAPVA